MSDQKPSIFLSRRQFIFTGVAAVIAAWLGAWVQSKLFPPPTVAEATPVDIALTDLPVGASKQITYAGAPALVMRSQDGVLALSLVCTHLGCIVQWDNAKKQFHCPCHDGKFDEFGDVIAGPPPLPLERLPVKMLADKIVVGETS
jgi:cytochrome b6-f complex iron-sulfur subunit